MAQEGGAEAKGFGQHFLWRGTLLIRNKFLKVV